MCWVVLLICLQELTDDPQFIVGGATRTDICQGALGEPHILLFSSVGTLLTKGDKVHQACPSVCRRLLALGGHRVSHPERQAPAPGRPTRTVLSGWLCRHLPLSGTLRWSSLFFSLFFVNKTSCNKSHQTWRKASAVFSCSSGSLVNGWMLWLMTDSLSKTGSWCSSTLLRAMNSGVHSWRKLTPSRVDQH